MRRIMTLSLAIAFSAAALHAQENDTVEELASEEEVASVSDSIGRINCTAVEVEKESDTLFEVDDAECEIGQYDIKLNENFDIISMTRDE